MIDKYLTPETIAQALELKSTYGDDATWFGGGSKLNAAPTKTEKSVLISLNKLGLDQVQPVGKHTLYMGAMCRIQTLVENELVPQAVRESASYIYSRNLRNQATLGGEIAANKFEAPLVPALLALNAQLLLASGQEVGLETYLASPRDELIQTIIIPDLSLTLATKKVARSADGLRVLVAAASIDAKGNRIVALDGITTRFDEPAKPIRLRDVEGLDLEGEALEQAIKTSLHPVEDICGSREYKRYIGAVVIADLLTQCQTAVKE